MNAQVSTIAPRRSFFRRLSKPLLLVSGILAVLLAVFIVNLVWFRPFSFRLFCERVFVRQALEHPELMTQLGIADSLGIDYFNSKLDDRSEAQARRLLAQAREELTTLRSYDRAKLPDSGRLSADILDWFIEMGVSGGQHFFFYPYQIEQMSGIQVALPSFMVNIHPLRTRRNVEDYLTRLSLFGRAFDQVIAFSTAQTGQGIVPPKFVLEKVLTQCREFTATPPRECALYSALTERLPEIKDVTESDRAVFQAEALAQVEQTVYSAFRRLTAHVETLASKASDDPGVWKLPRGDEFYAYCLRLNTTTDMTPERVHEVGLAEVARIASEMRQLLDAAGLRGKSVAAHMQDLARDPRFLFSNTDAGRTQAVAHIQGILSEANAQMSNYFGARPKTGMVVKRVEPFREKASAMGEYQQGSMDGSRPGIFYANLRNMEEFPRFSMRTLAYHEGVPGHHFQVTLAAELKGVPMFRRNVPFTAYVEGWALYAERLMWETGFHTDPYDNLGRLQDEIFRAARLVVDTGLHYKRWSRQKAIDYMMETTGMPETDLANEVDRYIVWPGQACAYKTGMLRILELRQAAKDALGPKFSLKEFHDVALLHGAMPLDILEREVKAYIARRSS